VQFCTGAVATTSDDGRVPSHDPSQLAVKESMQLTLPEEEELPEDELLDELEAELLLELLLLDELLEELEELDPPEPEGLPLPGEQL
jgi:hypothetical protein